MIDIFINVNEVNFKHKSDADRFVASIEKVLRYEINPLDQSVTVIYVPEEN